MHFERTYSNDTILGFALFYFSDCCHVVVSQRSRQRSHNADLLSNIPNPIKHKPVKNLNPLSAASHILL